MRAITRQRERVERTFEEDEDEDDDEDDDEEEVDEEEEEEEDDDDDEDEDDDSEVESLPHFGLTFKSMVLSVESKACRMAGDWGI